MKQMDILINLNSLKDIKDKATIELIAKPSNPSFLSNYNLYFKIKDYNSTENSDEILYILGIGAANRPRIFKSLDYLTRFTLNLGFEKLSVDFSNKRNSKDTDNHHKLSKLDFYE